jgi:phosphatidylglycerol:prolipoprotein diacylglycerol transferase
MRPVLFRIPLDGSLDLGPLGKLPVFGFGLLLGIWAAFGVFLWLRARRAGTPITFTVDTLTYGLLGVAVALAPSISARFGPHPGIPIFGYGLMMCLGFVSATLLAGRRAVRAGFPPETIPDLTLWFLISGVGGGRLFYLIQHGDRVFVNCQSIGDTLVAVVRLWDGGLVLYGGLIGGAIAYWWFCRSRKLPPWELGDLIVPSIFLGIAFGRVGCFLYGCCFGDRCELPWAVEFPVDSVPFKAQVQRGFLPEDATASLPIHPTQIYSVIDGLVLCLLTLAYYPVRARPGSVVTLALLTYPVTRFLIERLRGDEMGQFGTSLTIAQWISLAMFAGGIGLAVFRPPLVKRPAG